MKLSRPAIALYVGLIFASGGVLGVFGQRLYNASTASAKEIKSPDEFRRRVIAEYQRRLELSDDQIQKLNLIMDETQARFNEIHAKIVPELQAVHQGQIDSINGMLSPTQQPKYDALRKERQEQRQKQHQGRPGGGPGF
jgi:hypothetical protein